MDQAVLLYPRRETKLAAERGQSDYQNALVTFLLSTSMLLREPHSLVPSRPLRLGEVHPALHKSRMQDFTSGVDSKLTHRTARLQTASTTKLQTGRWTHW